MLFEDKNSDNTVTNDEVIQRYYYYPFGAETENTPWKQQTKPKIRYQYNGKEKIDELGLAWNDYGARNYDALLGRWMGVDALAEKYMGYSGYNYVMGNPIGLIDPDGMQVEGDYYGWKGNYLGTDHKEDGKVYAADSQNPDGTFLNAQDLGVTHDVFRLFCSTIYNESSKDGSDAYGIANATMNFLGAGGTSSLKTLDDVVAYENTFAFGASQDLVDKYKDAVPNSRFEIGAAINAIMGFNHPEARAMGHFKDYAFGTYHWDGADLLSQASNNKEILKHRNYSWSKSSKTVFSDFEKKFNDPIDTGKWNYSSKNYQGDAKGVTGKTVFYNLSGGRGEKKSSNKRIEF